MSHETPKECGNSPAEVQARIDANKAFFVKNAKNIGKQFDTPDLQARADKLFKNRAQLIHPVSEEEITRRIDRAHQLLAEQEAQKENNSDDDGVVQTFDQGLTTATEGAEDVWTKVVEAWEYTGEMLNKGFTTATKGAQDVWKDVTEGISSMWEGDEVERWSSDYWKQRGTDIADYQAQLRAESMFQNEQVAKLIPNNDNTAERTYTTSKRNPNAHTDSRIIYMDPNAHKTHQIQDLNRSGSNPLNQPHSPTSLERAQELSQKAHNYALWNGAVSPHNRANPNEYIHPQSQHGRIETTNGSTTIIGKDTHVGNVSNNWGTINIWGIWN